MQQSVPHRAMKQQIHRDGQQSQTVLLTNTVNSTDTTVQVGYKHFLLYQLSIDRHNPSGMIATI